MLGRISADACIGTRPGTFQSLRRAPAFATEQGSCQRGYLPCADAPVRETQLGSR